MQKYVDHARGEEDGFGQYHRNPKIIDLPFYGHLQISGLTRERKNWLKNRQGSGKRLGTANK